MLALFVVSSLPEIKFSDHLGKDTNVFPYLGDAGFQLDCRGKGEC